MDQKEATPRCELKVAQGLLAALPSLDGQTNHRDPLHCQKETARLIAEKGGEYFLQIIGNQPTLLQYARTQSPDAPFCPDRLRARTHRTTAVSLCEAHPMATGFPPAAPS